PPPVKRGGAKPAPRPRNPPPPPRHSDSVHIDRVDQAEGTRDGRLKLRKLSWAPVPCGAGRLTPSIARPKERRTPNVCKNAHRHRVRRRPRPAGRAGLRVA